MTQDEEIADLKKQLKDTEDLADKEMLSMKTRYDRACIEIADLRDRYSDWDRNKYIYRS